LQSKEKRSDSDFQTAVNTLQEFLEGNKIVVSDRAERFRSLWETRSPSLIFIDTEFAGDQLLEICVMTTEGEALVDTVVNHQVPTQTIYDLAENDMQRSAVDKIYGTEREKQPAGLTMDEIAEVLINKGFGTNSILVEWSVSRCDYWKLLEVFEHAGVEHLMPPRSNSWLILNDWREVVQKSKADLNCRLSLLYVVLQPDDNLLPTEGTQSQARYDDAAQDGRVVFPLGYSLQAQNATENNRLLSGTYCVQFLWSGRH
jgi:hypothetical protein